MNLTKRQREILCLAHLSYKEICAKLGIRKPTLQSHIVNIHLKFPTCESRHECQITALKEGIITLDEIVME